MSQARLLWANRATTAISDDDVELPSIASDQ
jgi:hypothetical protein